MNPRRLAFLLVLPALAVLGMASSPAHATPAGARSGAGAVWTATATATATAVRFEPTDPTVSALSVGGVGSFRGDLSISAPGNGLQVVNQVDFQDYLLGVREVPYSWPPAALQAQVIAARTFALWHALTIPSQGAAGGPAQICATDACQVYQGLAAESAPGAGNWAAAVASTDRKVLVYHSSVIFAAYGSSDGGQTTYGGVPWLPSVADPEDALSPLHQWHWQASLSSLAPLLGVRAPDQLTALTRSGDAVVLSEAGPAGNTTSTMALATFAADLDQGYHPAGLPIALPSSQFSLTTSGSQISVDGGGSGNGVGMSQYGALGRALEGNSAEQILSTYYGPAQAVALAANQMPATINVEVASGRSTITVSSSSPLKVVDPSGRSLAPGSPGPWVVSLDGHGAVHLEAPAAISHPVAAGPRIAASGPPALAYRGPEPGPTTHPRLPQPSSPSPGPSWPAPAGALGCLLAAAGAMSLLSARERGTARQAERARPEVSVALLAGAQRSSEDRPEGVRVAAARA